MIPAPTKKKKKKTNLEKKSLTNNLLLFVEYENLKHSAGDGLNVDQVVYETVSW